MKYSHLLLDAVDIDNFTVGDSLLVALIGIVVVFAVLAIIIFLLWGQSKIFQAVDKKKEKPAPVVAVPQPTNSVVQNNDDEIVAVISACVYAMLDEDETVDSDAEFVIRKIEKIKRSN